MKNSDRIEKAAENEVTAKLGLGGIITAKPSIDVNGTDFIGLLSIEDHSKICRIQVKGRSLQNRSPHIEIPNEYVSHAFFVFLYLRVSISVSGTNPIFVFFENDIKNWRVNKNKEFVLSIKKQNYSESLRPYLFTDDKVEKIKQIIENSNSSKEIEYIVRYGSYTHATHRYLSENDILYKENLATGVTSIIASGFDPNKYEINPSTDTYFVKNT